MYQILNNDNNITTTEQEREKEEEAKEGKNYLKMSRVPNSCQQIFMIFFLQLNLDQFNFVCAEFIRAFVAINHYYAGMLKFGIR